MAYKKEYYKGKKTVHHEPFTLNRFSNPEP